MPHKKSARDFFPESCSTEGAPACALPELADASKRCQGCDLFARATQTVFGEGDPDAKLMLVGEEPGDEEDVEGHPFVGPAGGLLDSVLEEAGIDRSKVWVTNAVKHFKWEPKGKRRIHEKPNWTEMEACRPWLEAEIVDVAPDVVVLMGATAAQSMLGRDFRISRARGEWAGWDRTPKVMATWHPSAVLRAPDREGRHQKRAELLSDMRKVAKALR